MKQLGWKIIAAIPPWPSLARDAKTLRNIAPRAEKRPKMSRFQAKDSHALTAREPSSTLYSAYTSGAYSLSEIGQFFGKHYCTVSRVARKRKPLTQDLTRDACETRTETWRLGPINIPENPQSWTQDTRDWHPAG